MAASAAYLPDVSDDAKETTVDETKKAKTLWISWVNGKGASFDFDEQVDLAFYRGGVVDLPVATIATQLAAGKHGPMVKVKTDDEDRVRFVPLAQVVLYDSEQTS